MLLSILHVVFKMSFILLTLIPLILNIINMFFNKYIPDDGGHPVSQHFQLKEEKCKHPIYRLSVMVWW